MIRHARTGTAAHRRKSAGSRPPLHSIQIMGPKAKPMFSKDASGQFTSTTVTGAPASTQLADRARSVGASVVTPTLTRRVGKPGNLGQAPI